MLVDHKGIDASAFGIGFLVTLVTSGTAWGVLRRFKSDYLPKWIPDQRMHGKLLQRIQRDSDIVEGSASVVTVLAALAALGTGSSSDVSYLLLVAVLLILGLVFGLHAIPPGGYDHYSWGPFTPLTDLLLLANGIFWLAL